MKDYHDFFRGRFLTLAILAVVVLVPCRPAHAQGQTQANVTGEVTDATKAAIPGVTITLLDVGTGQTWNASTDSQGHFYIPLLPVGNYRLIAEHSGFQKQAVENLALGVGATVQVNLTLQVGQLYQEVEVSVQAPLYETTNATTGSTIGDTQISDLPINGRDYARFSLLAPGALLRSSSIADLSFNGLELESNTFSIDGIDATRLDYSFIGNGSERGGRLFTGSMSSIGEFAIQTGTYGAQYGRSAGAYVNIVSKSGTNNVHGSIWEYARNTIFDARNYFSATNQPMHFESHWYSFLLNILCAVPMYALSSGRILFGAFELDPSTGELRSIEAPDPNNKVILREQVFQVLRMLLERESKIVTREEIKSISDLIRIDLGPTLLLCLCLVVSVFQSLCLANQAHPQEAGPQVSINPPIRLPIVDATDNRFLHLSTAEGVSQTKVDHMVQDNQGFMWFGTRYGLYRYDGYTLKVFVREPGNPNSLDGVSIKALFKDRDGALWVGCDQSLNKFDPTTESFVRYPIPLTTYITQDTDGLLWLATSGGLYRLDPASGGIQHYSHDPNDPSSLSSNDISYCGRDRRGTFWVASPAGLDEFDRRSGKITRHIILPDVANGFSFHEDRFGVFWILHASPNALAVFDRKTNTLTNYEFPKRGPALMKASKMLEDRNGALWIATHGLGLLKLDREQGKFVRYMNIPADPESLPQNKIDALLADRDGNIWVAPGRLPPALLVTKPPQFNKLPKVPGSTIEPFVGALFEDREGILWIGTPEALIRRDKTGRITEYRTGGREVGADVISICEDRSGSLWVGTYSHGLHRFDRRTGKFKTYRHDPADPHSLSNDVVMRLLVDHNGTLWAGTADGLNRFDAVTEHFTTYKLEPQSGVLCLELVEDREGKIWIGTESSGLRHFDPATGQFAVYKHDRNVPGTLSDHRVNSVHFDRSGTMWVGTQNGLDKFNPQTGSFSAVTQRDGLPGNAVGCILEDNNSNLWMSTNNGVAQFDSESKTFRNFSTAEGLPGPNLTGWGACFQSPSGEMFFGGFNGGTSFFPVTVMDSSYAPPIVLTDFRLFGNPVQVGGQSPLRRSISFTKDLILSHQQNVFSITLSALSYASPATNRYKYKLSNLERDWNEVGSDRRQAIYTTLPPGTYTFRAQGATRGGPWSEPGVALRIEILPPWWRTRPFQAAVSSLLLLIAWAGYRQRLHQVARQFEATLAERTRIARELHDTLLQNFHGLMFQFQAASNLMLRRPDEAKRSLDDAIYETKKALAESRDAIQGLRSEPIAKGNLAELLMSTSRELADADGSKRQPVFDLVEEGERRTLSPTVSNDICRIALELMRNAYQHAHARRIEAEIRYGGSVFRLRIRDDGKGIEPKVLKEGGKVGHWGLRGARERADRVGAHLDLWSEPENGTEVQLLVPDSVAYESYRDSYLAKLVRKVKRGAQRS